MLAAHGEHFPVGQRDHFVREPRDGHRGAGVQGRGLRVEDFAALAGMKRAPVEHVESAADEDASIRERGGRVDLPWLGEVGPGGKPHHLGGAREARGRGRVTTGDEEEQGDDRGSNERNEEAHGDDSFGRDAVASCLDALGPCCAKACARALHGRGESSIVLRKGSAEGRNSRGEHVPRGLARGVQSGGAEGRCPHEQQP